MYTFAPTSVRSRGFVPWASGVWCVGTTGGKQEIKVVFPLLCCRDTGVLPAKCTGCWDINSPRPKQHRHLVCGEGGGDMGGRRVAGKPDA